MVLHFVLSNRGKNLLSYKGYVFEKDYKNAGNGKIYWKCVEYNKSNCRGRAHSFEDEVIHRVDDMHNHSPKPEYVEKKKTMAILRAQAADRIDSTSRNVVAYATAGTLNAVLGILPPISAMKKIVQRVRKLASAFIPSPATLAGLNIVEPYTLTFKDEPFLLFDSGYGDSQRILLFSTQRNLRVLGKTGNHWLSDGTFKTVPLLFTQLMTIHAIKFHTVIPLVYALLPDKTKKTYIRVLQSLINLEPKLVPATVLTDFEPALFGAFLELFPNIVVRGCLFHFSQCVWRKIQSCHDILHNYREDSEFSLNLREILALAFVPVGHVIVKFQELMEQIIFIENAELLRPLLDYFEDNFVGRSNRHGQRRLPVIKLEHWNQYEATLNDLPRTNNSVEGWHRAFSSMISAVQANIWKFIDALKKEQNLSSIKLSQLMGGQKPATNKKTYKDVCANIKRIVSEYGSYTLEDYLKGIALNLEMQV